MKITFKKNIFCLVNIHNYYYGFFSAPVWGRGERHCIGCPKKQYRKYKPLGWINFTTPKQPLK